MLNDPTIIRHDAPSLTLRIKQKLFTLLSKKKRVKLLHQMRGKLTAKNSTIICSNCIAGTLYHDLGLPFLSPTINLFFDGEDFLRFTERLDYYLNLPLTFIKAEGFTCPVGKLEDVEIFFIHYKTEAEAAQKWEERKKRINWENIVIIATDRENMAVPERLKRFDRLPYKKIMYTAKDYPQYDWAVCVPAFKGRFQVGTMTGTANLKGERYYEADMDIIAWLNS